MKRHLWCGGDVLSRRSSPNFQEHNCSHDNSHDGTVKIIGNGFYEDSVISVGFTVLESNGEAERQLAERTMMLPAGSAPVRGFGDQAFIIQPGATVQRRMNLRRHHIVLEISAPGEIARSRLALALVAAIDEAELGRP
jgi:hypothetical protein